MSEFQEAASYGSLGIIAFVIIKWVLPTIKAITSKASVESQIYDNAKDLIDYTNQQLKTMQSRYDTLERLYEAERKERRRLEGIINGQHKE